MKHFFVVVFIVYYWKFWGGYRILGPGGGFEIRTAHGGLLSAGVQGHPSPKNFEIEISVEKRTFGIFRPSSVL